MWGRPADFLLRPELDGRMADVQVAVEDDDVLCARTIRLSGNRARDLGVLDIARDDHVLTFLDIRPDADGQLRVSPQTLFRGSRGQSPQSKSRGRPVQSVSSRAAPSTFSAVSSPGHGSRSELI